MYSVTIILQFFYAHSTTPGMFMTLMRNSHSISRKNTLASPLLAGQTDLEHDIIVKRCPGTYHFFCTPCDGLVVNPVLPYAPLSRLPAYIQRVDRGVRDLKVSHTAQRYYGNTQKTLFSMSTMTYCMSFTLYLKMH